MAAGADQNLNIIVRLKDEASKALEGLQKKMEAVEKSIAPAAEVSKKFATVLAGAGVAAAGFGVLAVKAAMDAEVETAKINKTINNTIENMSKKNANALQKLSDSVLGKGSDVYDFLTMKTKEAGNAALKMGFDDEAAAASMTTLFQRTNDVNKAMELNQLAMDLARAKSIGLSDASNMIGMILSGNGRALKQYGIEISDSMTPMEALDELQLRVGGNAKAFTGTFAGQAEVLKMQWGNLMETIGEKLIPILSVLMEKYLIPFVNDTLPKWIDNTQNINKWLSENKEVLIVVAGAIAGLLAPAIISMGIAFATAAIAAAPWLIGGAIIGGLVAGIVWMVKNWDMVKMKMGETWVAIKDQFRTGINFLIGLAEGWANMYVKAANTIIGALNKIKVSVPDWVPGIGGKSFGINISTVPSVSLPRMEHGGMVNAPRGTEVPAILHGGEQIIPAGNVRGGGRIVNISVTLVNPTFDGQNSVRMVKDQIDQAMRDVVRIHKLQTQ